jgi:FkbM family methyltransferase
VPSLPKQARTIVLGRLNDWLGGDVVAVQVGAHDGLLADPLRKSFVDHGWGGLLIEPHPVYCDKLRKLYEDRQNIRIIQCAVGEEPGSMTLYHLSADAKPGYPRFVRGCASFDRDRMLAALNHPRSRAVGGPEDLGSTDVPVRRLDEVLASEAWTRMDVLVVDVEGFELQVLASFAEPRPSLAIIECNGRNLPEESTYVAAMEALGLVVFRAGDDLIGVCEGFSDVPLEELRRDLETEMEA